MDIKHIQLPSRIPQEISRLASGTCSGTHDRKSMDLQSYHLVSPRVEHQKEWSWTPRSEAYLGRIEVESLVCLADLTSQVPIYNNFLVCNGITCPWLRADAQVSIQSICFLLFVDSLRACGARRSFLKHAACAPVVPSNINPTLCLDDLPHTHPVCTLSHLVSPLRLPVCHSLETTFP